MARETKGKAKEKVIESHVVKHTPPNGYQYKPLKSVILICSCGNKYVKTRENQKVCLYCVNGRQ